MRIHESCNDIGVAAPNRICRADREASRAVVAGAAGLSPCGMGAWGIRGLLNQVRPPDIGGLGSRWHNSALEHLLFPETAAPDNPALLCSVTDARPPRCLINSRAT